MKYEHICKAISGTPWAIHPPKMEEIIGVIEARSRGVSIDASMFREMREERESRTGNRSGVAVIGMHGTISHRVGLLEGSGGVSTEFLARQFDAAMADDDVRSIILDVASPGGSVFGLPELADKIYSARGRKKVTAIANAEAYSAAYYLGSAAEEFVATPSGMVGSIGTVMTHVDYSEMDKSDGINVTYIHSGKYKVEGHPHGPLDDEAKKNMQDMCDMYYADFVEHVAKHRNVTAEHVEENYGQGRVFGAKAALQKGMIDRIATFEQIVKEHVDAGMRYQQRRQMGMRAKVARLGLTT